MHILFNYYQSYFGRGAFGCWLFMHHAQIRTDAAQTWTRQITTIQIQLRNIKKSNPPKLQATRSRSHHGKDLALKQFRCAENGRGKRGVPWATPRWRRSRSSRIPGVVHIIPEQQNPRPIPLLCPLSPDTISDAHKHAQTPWVHRKNGTNFPPPNPDPAAQALLSRFCSVGLCCFVLFCF